MADFTRFISYLYDYRAGERNRNMGFAKVEVRQGMCRLAVNLNHGQVLQQNMMLCGYIAEEKGIRLIRLGIMEKGAREHQWRFPANDLGGSDLGPDGFSGLILLSEDRRNFLLTVWKDEKLAAEEIRQGILWEKQRTEENRQSEPQEKTLSESLDAGDTSGKDLQNCEITDGCESDEEDNHGRYQRDEENDEIRRQNGAAAPNNMPVPPEGWRTLCQLFPAARPFEPSVWEVLCISLQDIGRLPPENWVWGNNHFVLHSFYRYHHLVLARDRVENRVYLGVPGEFDTNETFMAAMFGLRRFERERKGKSEMGYWLTPVSLNAL